MARAKCIYTFGEFRLDGNKRVLLRADQPVRLPLKAIDVLLTLVEHCGNVVSKEELMTAVWPDKAVDEANLKQNIAVIRKSLSIEPGMPGHIETFVGRGYRIIGATCEPEPASSSTAVVVSTPAETVETVASAPDLPRFSPFLQGMTILVALVGVVALAVWPWPNNRVSQSPASSTVSRVTPITRLPGAESQPAITPDGKRVAFLWQQSSGKPPAIWVKSVEGEDPIRVGSREGRHASPAWSPDGQSIAYLSIGTDYTEVMVAAGDGSGERVLTRFPHSSYIFRQRMLDWSLDGKWLCLAHADDPQHDSALFLIDSQTGQQRRLTEPEPVPGNDMSPRFSPNGTMISYIRHIGRTDQELRLMPVSGGTPGKLLSEGRRITGQDWDSAGQSIIFASDRSGEFRLWRIPVARASAGPSPLEVFSEFPMDISIARKAASLVYSVEAEDRDIWRFDLQQKHWDRIIASSAQDASPQYSPDGSRICFRSNRSGGDQLWLADADGAHPVQLTKGALSPNFGHWSPDGRAIVFNDRGSGINLAEWRDGKWGIRRLGITGSHPVFSKDGQWLFIGRPAGIVRVSLDGAESATIAKVRAFSLAVSPDGETIYFSSQNGTEVWSVPSRGGEASKVLDGLVPGCSSCWALAPHGVYFLRVKDNLDEQTLCYHDMLTATDVEVAPYPEPLVPLGSGPFSLAPDNRHLLCVRTELPGGDLMKIEPFH